MVTRSRAAGLAILLGLLGACDGSSDSNTSSTIPESETSGASTAPIPTSAPAPEATEPEVSPSTTELSTTELSTTVPAPSTDERSDIVAFDGSVEDVLGDLDDASNFAAGVSDWLAAVPGQEGVLRNTRGVTLFVPLDSALTADAADLAFEDPDLAAITISEHLSVGRVGDLEPGLVIAMASGVEVTVEAGPTVGGFEVVRTEQATNGVVHVIDGVLPGRG